MQNMDHFEGYFVVQCSSDNYNGWGKWIYINLYINIFSHFLIFASWNH